MCWTTAATPVLMYSKDPSLRRPEYGTYLDVDENGMVTDLEMDPTHPRYENTCMDTLFISKKLLIDLMDRPSPTAITA